MDRKGLNASNIRASNRKRVSEPLKAVKDRYVVEYNTCADAWNDVLFWLTVIYGDSYANYGGNTLLYFVYMYAWDRVPLWLDVCFN